MPRETFALSIDAQSTFAEKDLIYKAYYEGWYSVSDETYYTESQIRDHIDTSGQPVKVCRFAF